MYDDGMYYATMPDENGNINNEMFVENNNISTFSYVPVIQNIIYKNTNNSKENTSK